MAKNSDDALQIVEQVLPFFQPDYTLTINDMADMGIKRDIPIVLNSVSYEDSYRGDYAERRAIIYTLAFTSKFYLYGTVTSAKVIKTVQVDQYANLQDQAPKRDKDIQLHLILSLLTQMMILVSMKLYLSFKMQRIEI